MRSLLIIGMLSLFCSFLRAEAKSNMKGAEKASAQPKVKKDLSYLGFTTNIEGILVVDNKKRRTGYVDGETVREIPESYISSEKGNESPEEPGLVSPGFYGVTLKHPDGQPLEVHLNFTKNENYYLTISHTKSDGKSGPLTKEIKGKATAGKKTRYIVNPLDGSIKD